VKKKVIALLAVIIVGLYGMLPIAAHAQAAVISSVLVSPVTENSAVISWSTDLPTYYSRILYGTAQGGPYGSATSPYDLSSMVAQYSHMAAITGLAADTTYYYNVESTWDNPGLGNDIVTTSSEYSFTTNAFTISGVTSSNVTSTSATVTWNTNVLATSNVNYGLTTGYGWQAPGESWGFPDNSVDRVAHSVVLAGLTPNTLYHYQIVSIDKWNDTEMAEDRTFQTQADPPPVISHVIPDGSLLETDASATISWDTDETSSSRVEYGTTSSTHGNYANITPLDAVLIENHSVLLGALIPDTQYFYRVISADAYDNEVVSAEFDFTTASDNTQPVISDIATSAVTATSATITWSTDEEANSTVKWGSSLMAAFLGEYASTKNDATLVTSHQLLLTNMTPNTTYHYRIWSTDAYTNEAVGPDNTFTTLADSTVPVISNVQKTGITGSSITIIWSTNEPSTSHVKYGLTDSYGSQTVLDTNLLINHSVSIGGLADGTTFHFRVVSSDDAGNPAQSADDTFDTLDATAPTVPGSFAKTTANNDNTPTFTWTASTDASSGIDYYEIQIDGGAWTDIGNVTTYDIPVESPLADGEHIINLRAVDVPGNPSAAATTTVNIDATGPTAVTSLAKEGTDNDATPTFTWTGATDALAGVSYYQIRVGMEVWGNTGNVTTYTRTTGLADGAHTFYIRAVDAAGNIGAEADLAFTVDTASPTAPTSLAQTTDEPDTTPTFTWEASIDTGAGIASYEVKIGDADYIDVGNVTTYTVTTELAAGKYILNVRAVDGAGNAGIAGTLNFTISAAPALSTAMLIIIVVAAVVVVGAGALFVIMRRKKRAEEK